MTSRDASLAAASAVEREKRRDGLRRSPRPPESPRAPATGRAVAARTADGDSIALEVKELTFGTGGRRILDRVSFALKQSELTVVMGPSGSGKTTLLKCLNRLLEPTSGRVEINGTDTTELSPVELRRRIGMVWQTPFMFEGSVGQNLERAAAYSATLLDDDGGSRLLERVAFDGDVTADARKLSVGQQQRVAMARALIARPQLLLCDEPTASLDQETSLRLEATLRQMCAGGMTIVFVTHDGAQADRIADRKLLLQNHRLTEVGNAVISPAPIGER